MNIKSKFILVLMGAFYFGFGAGIRIEGGGGISIVIWTTSILVWLFIALFILPDIKEILFSKNTEIKKS
jgi:hypothetical protein